ISATNRDLTKEVEAGKFRQDLYYRLAVFQINLPALRERVVDIPSLAAFFLHGSGFKMNKKTATLSPEVIALLKLQPWKGNIRELKNVMERSVILSNDGEITPDLLPQEMQMADTVNAPGKQLSAFELASAEKLHIQKVLNYTGRNKTETAKLLNIALTTLYRKMEEYKLN
ncbi:MAG: sigma-54-dependent Fis family transcriptional regulator, partial [Chryseobacterium sp.]